MSDLILTEFDLQEFNEWMLTIQKASEDLNYIHYCPKKFSQT